MALQLLFKTSLLIMVFGSALASMKATIKRYFSATDFNATSCPVAYSFNNNNSNPPCCSGIMYEGCAQYEKGPQCWASETAPKGAYGWIVLTPPAKSGKTEDCLPIPTDGIGKALGPDTPLYPVNLEAVQPKASGPKNTCVLACNMSEVTRTGVDPCNKGTIPAGKPLPPWLLPPFQTQGSAQVFKEPLVMSCYFGGKGFMNDPTMGMCGYGVFLRNTEGEYCKTYTEPKGCPIVWNDSRDLPCCGGSKQCNQNPPPMCCGCQLDNS